MGGPHFSKIARCGHPRDLLLRFTFEFHMWATRLSFPSAGGAWPILCGFSPRVGIPDFEPPGILTWFLPQSNGITFLQFRCVVPATKVGKGLPQCEIRASSGLCSGTRNPMIEASVESHPSKNEG